VGDLRFGGPGAVRGTRSLSESTGGPCVGYPSFDGPVIKYGCAVPVDMYLSYFGVRVTDLRRSAEFYTRHFGLQPLPGSELPKQGSEDQTAFLLVDPHSGQRIELNFYPKGNPYAVPYVAGEGLDHLAFRVDDLEKFLAQLKTSGISPEKMKHYEGPMMSTPSFRVAYIRDPDDNQIEIYDSPGADPDKYDRTQY